VGVDPPPPEDGTTGVVLAVDDAELVFTAFIAETLK
jgi:hypothetical protein